MVDWVNIIIPIGTFVVGIFTENFRLAKSQKLASITNIENLLKEFLEQIEKERKTYILKFHYNQIYKAITGFCSSYNLDKSYFEDELIDLNIYACEKQNPNKVSDLSISLINKIKAY